MYLPEKVKISETVLFQEIEGESVLLNMKTEQYFGLDEVGTRIWGLLGADGSTAGVLNDLKKIYGVDIEVLRADLAALIDDLLENELISVVE